MKNEQSSFDNEKITKLFKKRFRKINDPNFSLFNEEYTRYKYMKRILIIFFVIGLPLFIFGLILLIRRNVLGVIPITFGGLAVMMVIYLPIHLIDRAKFKTIIELKETKQFDKLLELARKYSLSSSFLDQEKARLATYVLIDNKSLEIAHILKSRIIHGPRSQRREVMKAFYLLAKKFGYDDHRSFFLALDSEKELAHSSLAKDKLREQKEEFAVPISKVYFIHEIPKKAKCMVSGLQLDFKKDTIVVCPYCSAWADKKLLESWLEDKGVCPVCRRDLDIEGCPIVTLTK